MKAQDMTQRYRKFKRSWGMWYALDTAMGNSVSLKTRVADANESRDWRLFADFAQVLIQQASSLYTDEPFGAEVRASAL